MSIQDRIKADWKNQPLAIFSQWAGIIIAIAMPFVVAFALSPSASVSLAVPQTSFNIAIVMSVALICATLCRVIFKLTVIGGFFISLVLATVCLLVLSIGEKDLLLRTTSFSAGVYKGPLIDLMYWAIYSEFVAVCCAPAMQRITETWGEIKFTDENRDPQKSGVAPLEFIAFAAIWGWALSGAQQEVIAAFIFQQPPGQAIVPRN